MGQTHRSVETSGASQRAAEYLQVAPGSPVMVLRSTMKDVQGRPVETFIAFHRSDRSRFDVVLNGQHDSALMLVRPPQG